ncbi:hypothetical protein M2454_000123 [Aequitasia blattaphilus]
MHYAVHGHTAAELIVERANSEKDHRGLTTWAEAPSGKIKKTDVTVAKNYLSEFELSQLDRMVSAYIEMFEYGLLNDAGKVSAEIAKLHAETEFGKYRVIQDKLFMSDFDKFMLELEDKVKEKD